MKFSEANRLVKETLVPLGRFMQKSRICGGLLILGPKNDSYYCVEWLEYRIREGVSVPRLRISQERSPLPINFEKLLCRKREKRHFRLEVTVIPEEMGATIGALVAVIAHAESGEIQTFEHLFPYPMNCSSDSNIWSEKAFAKSRA
jgi:hypothetical protein